MHTPTRAVNSVARRSMPVIFSRCSGGRTVTPVKFGTRAGVVVLKL